ncbi:hypothetical protein PV783_25035 [Chitinophaga sp. CC14]|uniref:hypothetical protein n=1 Tax=Chitinophaga sp. CC14 TaxID=3029199 RepID=UPI003B7F754E
MRKKMFLAVVLLTCIISITVGFPASAQSISELKITAPFDSLGLTAVTASGNVKTGTIEVSMIFKNNYSKMAGVSLSLGGFPDFGITDAKGRKYKLHTDGNAVNTNKGYQDIPFIQFGDKKFTWVATVAQQIPPTETRKLIVRINKLDRSTGAITDFHIRCILSLDYGHIGDKVYKIENLKVDWN